MSKRIEARAAAARGILFARRNAIQIAFSIGGTVIGFPSSLNQFQLAIGTEQFSKGVQFSEAGV